MNFSLDFVRAYPHLGINALFRQQAEDFEVTELLSENFFSADGEHHCFHIEKCGENTAWVAKMLADYFAIEEMAIGYCGLKDRHAVTRQWFSVHLPGKTKVSAPALGDSISVLDYQPHHKKLRRGEHQGNRFRIRLRNLSFPDGTFSLANSLELRLRDISEKGVPNYFGEQRFGREGNNLVAADELLRRISERNKRGQRQRKDRKRKKPYSNKQGIYLSAARSYLFNKVLSERITQGEWQTLSAEATGPLWGRGRSPAMAELAAREQQILKPWHEWLEALEFSGLNQERRILIMQPTQFSYEISEGDLVLVFELSSGQYATSLLRELASLVHLR